LGARAERLGSARAQRDVRVAAHVAALHARLADAERAGDVADRAEIRLRELRRAVLGTEDRLRHDLDERHARAVVVDERRRGALDAAGGSAHVRELARVLLHVRALDRDVEARAVGKLDLDGALERDRLVVLADLVILAEVGVEVVLPRKAARRRDRAAEREAQADRAQDGLAVDDGHRSGQAEVDGRDERVRLSAVELLVGRVARGREHLRARVELDVHLEPDDGLVLLERGVEVHERRSHQRASPFSTGARSSSGAPHSSTSSASSAALTRYRRASSYAGARNWIPTGSPSSLARPDGTEMPGTPARFAGIVARSFAYIASGSSSFSPRRKAVVGADGVAMTSTLSNASAKSRWMSVRTFCALP